MNAAVRQERVRPAARAPSCLSGGGEGARRRVHQKRCGAGRASLFQPGHVSTPGKALPAHPASEQPCATDPEGGSRSPALRGPHARPQCFPNPGNMMSTKRTLPQKLGNGQLIGVCGKGAELGGGGVAFRGTLMGQMWPLGLRLCTPDVKPPVVHCS